MGLDTAGKAASSPELKNGLQDDFNAASIKLKGQEAKLNDFLRQTGRGEDRARVQVQGFGKSQAQKAVAANRQKDTRAEQARINDLFYIIPPSKGDAITAQSIYKQLNKSAIGKETLSFIIKNKTNVEITYSKEVRRGLRGEAIGNNIFVYAENTKTRKLTAQTIIHEATHIRYNIGGDQWSEAVCFAQEEKHVKDVLTFADKRRIIKTVKRLYPEYDWRKR